MTILESLVTRFPKKRPPMALDVEAVFREHYLENRSVSNFRRKLVLSMENWMHWQVAKQSAPNQRLLEVGAGNLNHLPFEKDHHIYDVVEPFNELFAQSQHQEKIRQRFLNLADIDTQDRYDRIFSVAVLEHMTNLPWEIARCGLLLDENGMFQAGIPNEGCAMWEFAWRCTTGIVFYIQHGLAYDSVIHYEHVNDEREIMALIQYLFADVSVLRFPLPYRHLSLYSYFEARSPHRDLCREILAISPEKRP